MSDKDAPEHGTADREQYKIENSDIPNEDKELLVEFSKAISSERPRPKYKYDGEIKEFSDNTRQKYLQRLRIDFYKNGGPSLTEATAEELNDYMSDLDVNRSRSTTLQAQSALRAFYRYHDDLQVDAADLDMFKNDRDNNRVTEESVLSEEEVDMLRDAMDQSGNPVRNRALLEVFVNTGQRLDAVRTLRLQDCEVHEKPGYIKLNPDCEGLKGADGRGLKRPVFHGRKAIRDWADRHPYKNRSDAYLFVGDPSNWNSGDNEPLKPQSIRDIFRRAAEAAGLEYKRCRPHELRHYWVTRMYRDHGLSWDEICALGGWVEDSQVPKTIYNHLQESELHESAEKKVGVREDEGDDEVRTKPCEICGETVKPDLWDECPNCHEALGPAADSIQESPLSKLVESAAEADGVAAKGAIEAKDILEAFPHLEADIKADMKEEVKSEVIAEIKDEL